MTIPSSGKPTSSGLVVIARNAAGRIVTRITSHRDLVGAIHTVQSVLKLKLDAVHMEVHHGERSTAPVSWETAACGKSRGPAGRATDCARQT